MGTDGGVVNRWREGRKTGKDFSALAGRGEGEWAEECGNGVTVGVSSHRAVTCVAPLGSLTHCFAAKLT